MAVMTPVASATYGPNGKISSSLSFPYKLHKGEYAYKGVLVYELPDEIVRGKLNTFQANASFSFTSDGAYGTVFADACTYLVDNTLENILGDTLDLSNLNPGNYQNDNVTVTTWHEFDWHEYSANATKSQQNIVRITTAQYLVVYFSNYWGSEEPDSQYATGFSVSYEGASDSPLYSIESVYPLNVNIKNNIDQIFTWRRPNNAPPLTKHIIKYRKKGTSNFTDLIVSDGNPYQTVLANTFDVDQYEYKVQEYTYYDIYLVETNLNEFVSIGQDAAPTISGVTNDAIPTISWTDSNQAAYEIRIKDANQNIVYASGMMIGADQSHQIKKMLSNGTYIAEVRELNIYGAYSDWGSTEFVINPASVTAPTDVAVIVNNKGGVEISGTPVESAQKTYVVRRKIGTDNIEIIGIYTGETFVDYTAEGNTYYEYSLRNYNVAYADGAFTPVEVRVKQAIIQDGRDLTNYLDLSWSEDAIFNINRIEEADRTLFNCLGRRYPVKEVGEWINSVRTFVAYVKAEDVDRLYEMNLNAPKVYYKGNHEYYACDMSIEDQGAYVGGGQLIQFTLTRIADDEGIII